MVHFAKWVLVVSFLLVAGFLIPSHALAQQAPQAECDFTKVTGTVSSINWVGSVLVVDTGGDQLFLVISRETTFTKYGHSSSFSEVNQGDSVVVRYFDCGFAGLKAVAVNVTNGP